MKHLSIIIPATGSQSDLDDTLVSILENCPQDCEVLLVHPDSYVDPYDLGDEVRLIRSEEEDVLSLINQGLKACRGAIVHALVPGMIVGPGWCDAALQRFHEDRNIASVAPNIIAQGNRHTIQGIAYHARRGKSIVKNPRLEIVGPLVQAGFYRTSAFRFMHGFDVRFGEYADVELGLRLRSANYKTAKCDSPIHCTAKFVFSPQRGFQGGVQRGELFNLARQLGLSNSMQGWFVLLGEPINNRFGVGTIASMFGHASTWQFQPSDVRQLSKTAPKSRAARQRDAA